MMIKNLDIFLDDGYFRGYDPNQRYELDFLPKKVGDRMDLGDWDGI
ncbi:hypothetical protein [Paraburkholderia sp. GAS32]